MADPVPQSGESRFCAAPDGLRLHYRHYRAADGAGAAKIAVACLPGLTRTEADFTVLAAALAARGHAVVAIDYRGRGLSDWAADPAQYAVPVEAGDVLAVLDNARLSRAAVIGTSRGGLIALALGSTAPQRLAGIVFNDIGPVLAWEGLRFIKAYVGRAGVPADFAQGAAALKRLFGAEFPTLSEAGWRAWAGRAWRQTPTGLVATSDPRIAVSLEGLTAETPPPALWPLFDALPDVPLMVVRGALSKLLSPDTVAEMQRRRPGLRTHLVPDQGHAPLLDDAPTIAAIADFLRAMPAATG